MRRIPVEELRTKIFQALRIEGHSIIHSNCIADTLMFAELRGNNQGVIKLISGSLKPNRNSTNISTIHESLVSARLDGGQCNGMVVVSTAVDIVITKAKSTGISIVGCSNYSSPTGALGYWARKIADSGLVGIVMSQCPEMVAPHGSYQPIFGTNPIAIGVPTAGRSQVLDMATSSSAWYGLVTAEKEGKSIPLDVAYDSSGHPTSSPSEALKGALRVFDRGHKGSHLSLMVELLAGALTGAAMSDKKESNNWGSFLLAFDPQTVMGIPLTEFQTQSQIMCDRVKAAPPLPSEDDSIHQHPKEIFLPGERGDRQEKEALESGTLEILESVYIDLNRFILENSSEYEKSEPDFVNHSDN